MAKAAAELAVETKLQRKRQREQVAESIPAFEKRWSPQKVETYNDLQGCGIGCRTGNGSDYQYLNFRLMLAGLPPFPPFRYTELFSGKH